jgi:phage terminase small subunit
MLKNPKWEHFAQLMAKGVTATESAVTAGFAEKRATVTGSELAAKPEVRGRIAELQRLATERVTEKTGIDRAWVMNELVEIVKLGKTGEPIINSDGEPTGEYKAAQNLAASNKALELIGKEFSMFVDRSEVKTGPLDGLDHADLQSMKDAINEIRAYAEPVGVVAKGAGSTRH